MCVEIETLWRLSQQQKLNWTDANEWISINDPKISDFQCSSLALVGRHETILLFRRILENSIEFCYIPVEGFSHDPEEKHKFHSIKSQERKFVWVGICVVLVFISSATHVHVHAKISKIQVFSLQNCQMNSNWNFYPRDLRWIIQFQVDVVWLCLW